MNKDRPIAHEIAIEAARAVLQSHIDALNARDENAIAATLHFPHYRLSGVDLKIWENADRYFDDFQTRAGTNWSRSEFNDIKVVDASDTKVHLDVEVRRYDRSQTCITRFRSLWVITKEGDHWAAKMRSSFASL